MRAIFVIALLAGTAAADPLDAVGFGAAAAGMAESRTAMAVGAEAAHVDPAGVARGDRPEVLVGWQYSLDHLELDGHDAHVVDAHGTSIGLAVPFQLGRVRVGAGVALYLPDQYLARVELTPVSEPHFVRFESEAQRVVVEPVVAIAFGDFAIGAGASLLADARSRDLTFDVGVIGGQKQGNASLDVALPIRAAPLAGIWWRPHRKLELAATFRGELSLDLALDIRANVSVPGVVTGDAVVSLRSTSYFTPMRAGLAAAFHPTDDLVLTADLAWERWSTLGSGVPDLSVLVELDLTPPLISTMPPPARFHDIPTVRLGTERTYGAWKLRGGLAWLPSPVPAQTGLTSFADGARLLATAGVGVQIAPGGIFTRPIDLDLGLAWQQVAHALVTKDPAVSPGGAFSSGGDILQASMSATVRF